MDIPTAVNMAKDQAKKMGLDPALVCAVVEQESNWNLWAIRAEKGFETRYIDPLGLKNMTEVFARSMSWGLMQLMGEVAREMGFTGTYLSQLCDPPIGLLWGCKKLAQCLDAKGGDPEKALLMWNGGGNPNYANEVLARIKKYW
jgi:soluble lytic murein transglycosylase-like protein